MQITISSLDDITPENLRKLIEVAGGTNQIRSCNMNLVVRCFKEKKIEHLNAIFEFIDVNEYYGDGTALSWAVYAKMEDYAARLLKAGADPNAIDKNRTIADGSPLWYSIRYDVPNIFKLLLESGATASEELLEKAKKRNSDPIYVELLEKRIVELNPDIAVKAKEIALICNALNKVSESIDLIRDVLQQLSNPDKPVHAQTYEQHLKEVEDGLNDMNRAIAARIDQNHIIEHDNEPEIYPHDGDELCRCRI